MAYPNDPDWSAGTVSKTISYQFDTGQTKALVRRKSYEKTKPDGTTFADDGEFPITVSPGAEGDALPKTEVGDTKRLVLLTLEGTRVAGTSAATSPEPFPEGHQVWKQVANPGGGYHWELDRVLTGEDPRLATSQPASFRLSLIDGSQKVVPEGAFKVHLCPRYDHDSPNPPDQEGRPCTVEPIVSQNGVVDVVNANEGPVDHHRGYLGIEMTKVPTEPGTYYVRVESLTGDYRVRRQSDWVTGSDITAGEFEGAFAICSADAGEFLDQNFARLSKGIQMGDSAVSMYVRWRAPDGGDANARTVALSSFAGDGTTIQDAVPLQLNRIGSSPTFLGRFTAIPDGYSGPSVQGTSLTLALADGYAVASTASVGAKRVPHLQVAQAAPIATSPTAVALPFKIEEVGFANDFKITRYPNPWRPSQPSDLIDPDDTVPVWKRAVPPVVNDPVAYQRGSRPTVFGRVTYASRPYLESATVSLKVAVTGCVDQGERCDGDVAELDGAPHMGGQINFRDLRFSRTTSSVTRQQSLTFKWSLRLSRATRFSPFGNAGWWVAINDSGPHTFYWTFGAPLIPPFKSVDGTTFDELYDEALRRALDAVSGYPGQQGDPVSLKIRDEINVGVDGAIAYDPGAGLDQPNDHPLRVYEKGAMQCKENSFLLRGLFRSVGLDGEVRYYWGGTSSEMQIFRYRASTTQLNGASFRVTEPFRTTDPDCSENPHFTFHAMVTDHTYAWDPSYGKRRNDLPFTESVRKTESGYDVLTGNESQQTGASLPGSIWDSQYLCPHDPPCFCNR